MSVSYTHLDVYKRQHPECTGDILELSDFIGSTSQIIDYATKSENNTFIICTEDVYKRQAEEVPNVTR